MLAVLVYIKKGEE